MRGGGPWGLLPSRSGPLREGAEVEVDTFRIRRARRPVPWCALRHAVEHVGTVRVCEATPGVLLYHHDGDTSLVDLQDALEHLVCIVGASPAEARRGTARRAPS